MSNTGIHGVGVETVVSTNGDITQEVYRTSEGVREVITRTVLRTSEEHVREALISLGWTPPPGTV